MIYGRRRVTSIFFSYVYEGGVGHTTLNFRGYRGMTNHDLLEVQKKLSKKVGKPAVIKNWKVLHERS